MNSTYLAENAHKKANIELHFYGLPNIHRVIATDRGAYITFYENSAHGRNSPRIYVRRPRLLYDAALLLITSVRRDSRPADGSAKSQTEDSPGDSNYPRYR